VFQFLTRTRQLALELGSAAFAGQHAEAGGGMKQVLILGR
jgi:hypothetical protein